jgi:hypothetical protein
MSVAVNTPTSFLPITSLQLQYFQAVTHSFVRRRSTNPPVFNNFRTLSVATGVVPLSVSLSVQLRLPVPALHCLAVLPVSTWSVSRTIVPFVRSVPATKRSHQAFLVKNNSECKILRHLPSPFNAVYRHSMHRNTVRRKVWSHTANSGRLDAETFGGSALLFHCWLHLWPAGRHNLTICN